MAQQWFRRVAGQVVGPLTSKMLKDMAGRGEIQPDEQILDDQSKKWILAGKIQGLVFGANAGRQSSESIQGAGPPATDDILLPGDELFQVAAGQAAGPVSPPLTAEFWETATPIPEALAVPSSVAARGPSSHSRPFANTGVLIGVIAGVILLIAAACTGTYFLAQKPDVEKAPDVDEELKAERGRLREEIDELKGEVRGLEDNRDGLQKDAKDLERTKEQLQKDIDDLTAKKAILNRWKGVDLVLMNAKQQAVGLKQVGKSFVVFDKQEGSLAQTVLAVSRNLHIARTLNHAQLAKDVYNQVDAGKTLPPDLETRVRESIWKTHQFVQVRPDTSTKEIDLVVFRDIVTSEVRIGFLHEATTEGLRVEARGAPRELVPWGKIQAGSARHGTPDAILPMMGNVDFLEYSLLRVAQKVGTGDQVGVSPRVIVHSDIEVDKSHLDHYHRIDEQLAEQGRPLESFYAEGDLGIAFLFFDSLRRSAAVERRHSLWKEMEATSPNKRARHLAQFLEDEVQSRMFQWGIPTVSDKDLAKFESGSTSIGKAVRAATLHDATHLLYVTVKESRNSGDYHLAVRLFDETGKDTWMNEGDRALSPEPQLERYHASSGDLVVLTLMEKEPPITSESPKGSLQKAVALLAPETPPKVTVGRARGAKEQRSELVYLESSQGGKTRFRTLFDDRVKEIATGVVEKVVPVKNPMHDVSQDLIYRYVLARFAQQLLPPAGRVESVTGLNGEVVGLSTNQGMIPGDRCRVLRSVDGLRSHSVLPTEAELSDVGSSISRVTFEKSGFEDLYAENVLMKQGDLLMPRDWKTRSVRVEPLRLEEPVSGVRGNLKFGSFGESGTGGKYRVATEKASALVSRRMADALASAGISTAAPMYGRPDFPTTHRVHGTITLSPDMQLSSKYNPSSSPLFQVSIMLSEVGATGDLVLVKFDITENSL